jgi:hypothetical protein
VTEYTFNAPPGWPPAPPGWVPPQGWVPDPSWPPAPEGWQWWLPPVPVPPDSLPAAPMPAESPDGDGPTGGGELDLSKLPAPAPVQQPAAPHEPTWREKRAAKHQAKDLARQQKEWADEQDAMDRAVATVQSLAAGNGLSVGLILKPGEQAVWVGNGQLVEPKRGPGHYAGGSQGFSFRVAKGVRYRVGASRGHFIPGDEVQTVIDQGTVTVTTQRVVFTGSKATREWTYAKLLDTEISQDRSLVLIHVSNRQKVSGIKTAPAFAEALSLGVTLSQHGIAEVAQAMKTEADEHRSHRP